MALNFPPNPSVNDEYTIGTKVYKWSGAAWLVTKTSGAFTQVTISSTTTAISTITGSLIVAGGVGIGKDLHVGGILYTNGVPVITTASFNVSDGPDGGVDINIQHYVNTVTGTSTIFINNISTLQSVTGRGNTTNNKLIITDTSESTTTNVGALVVSGGIGVGKRVNCESLRIADSIFDSTAVTLNTTASTQIDSFLSSQFRSAKYFVQISSGGGLLHTGSTATFHAAELILITDNVSTTYSTEYGLVTTNGSLGSFSADLAGGVVRLYFTPTTATNKTIKVLRTSMAS